MFALNETYHIGDGKNADLLRGFALMPDSPFVDRLEVVLYPPNGAAAVAWQYQEMMDLIDAVEALVADQGIGP